MTMPAPVTDLAEADPGLPRFASLACGIAITAAIWLVAVPPRVATTVQTPTDGDVMATVEPLSGGSLFVREGCGACHATAGQSTALGPSLAGVFDQAQSRIASPDYMGFAATPEDYVREATLDHCVDLIAGYDYDCETLSDVGLRLSNEQVENIVAFLIALPGGGGP